MLSIPQVAQTTPHHHQQTVLLLQKPFVQGCAARQDGPYSWLLEKQTRRGSVTVSLNKQRRGSIKAVVSPDVTEIQESVNVKAVLTVQVTMGGFLSSIGIEQGLNSITDLLGKSLLLELVSAELDPGQYFFIN